MTAEPRMELDADARFTRHWIGRGEAPVPLAFAFDGAPLQAEHAVTVVGWTSDARQMLRNLNDHLATLKPRRNLPVEALRGRLHVGDADNLRLDRGLGLRGLSPAILWAARPPDDARERVGGAVLGWLVDDVATTDAIADALARRLKRLARDGKLVDATRRVTRIFDWEQTLGGTAKAAAGSRDGYADLADFVARRLEGEEALPGLGGLRRIASGRLDSNLAELMTEPTRHGRTQFSLVVRVRVFSYPGRPTPVVVLELSRRIWTHAFKGFAARELSACALPEGAHTGLRFTLRRETVKTERGGADGRVYQPGADFAPIARAYGLPLGMTGSEIAAQGHLLRGCPLFVVHKHGVGERAETKQGVPDVDKMAAFRRTAELLAPHGLCPWDGLTEVPTATRPVKDRNQHWRGRDEDEEHREAFERWRAEAKEDIAACYAEAHQIVVAYHQDCYHDAEQARTLLDELLDGHVRVQLIPIPHDVHGPRAALPRPTSTTGKAPRDRDYAELRAQAWKPFIAEAERYRDETGARIDGILAIVPEWYGENESSQAHDDRVNKRAGRITLAQALRAPVQYLRPEREDGQRFRQGQDPAKMFENRLVMAWLDLAWKTVGRIKARRLTEGMGRIYGTAATVDAAAVLPPDRVLAIGILRRNRTRSITNEKSFVPFAIELDLDGGTCLARFARERGVVFEPTPLQPLPDALVELASSGPIELVTEKTDQKTRQAKLQERSQSFFHTAITDFCQRAVRPLVLIDAVTCRGMWPWVADTKLDAANVVINKELHAEADWDDIRIVRVRTQNAPKVLFDGYFQGSRTDIQPGDEVRYDAPKWANAQLFKLMDTRAQVFLSFGSLLRTGLRRGRSCYREIEGLKQNKGKPRTIKRETIEVFTGAWSTPSAVEFTVVRTAAGEEPEQLAAVVEQLRTLFTHFGDWSVKPAPLYFERALKEYLADYDLDEEDDDDEDADESDSEDE